MGNLAGVSPGHAVDGPHMEEDPGENGKSAVGPFDFGALAKLGDAKHWDPNGDEETILDD